MANIHTSILSLMGRTPLVALENLGKQEGLRAKVLVKLESKNPGGSAKDRVALAMVRSAEEHGILRPGATIIEPTSGNTGIGLAAVATAKGYKCIIVMPDSMSRERVLILTALGAEVVLTPGGMSAAIVEAERIAAKTPGSWIAGQFCNPANPSAHYETTGPEIWADTDGKVDIFVAGIGTGGTISGVGNYLKEQDPSVRIVGVEPADSPLLTQGRSGRHGLQGIGADFIPEILDRTVLDRVIPVSTEESYAAARALGRTEGILCGISSGAALHAALMLAKEPENAGKTIVALLPDSGERYLSTELFTV